MTVIKSIHKNLFIVILLTAVFFPGPLTAKVFIATEIASGQVISITSDHTILLDDGFSYYSVKKNIPFLIKPGQTLSIRYYMDDNGKKNYMDAAPGKNSLEHRPVPKSTKTLEKKR